MQIHECIFNTLTTRSTLQPLLEPTTYINPIKCNEATVIVAVALSHQLSNIIIEGQGGKKTQ